MFFSKEHSEISRTCGFYVAAIGVDIDEEKITMVRKWPIPCSKKFTKFFGDFALTIENS